MITIETNYISTNPILSGFVEKAVKKYMPLQPKRVVFFEVAAYIKRQLIWKKQDTYTHALPLLKCVCDRIAEDFASGCDYACPDAKNYRDLYFAIIF